MTAQPAPQRSRRVLVPLNLPPPQPVAAQRGVQVLGGKTMGTTWSVRFVGPVAAADLHAVIEAVLARIIAQMSPWEPESDISRFNAAPAGTWHSLATEFAAVMRYAVGLAEATGGAYDPTVGPLVDLWGFGPAGSVATPPKAADVEAARAHCGWQRLCFEAETARMFQPGGVHLDLSSIAKGYAVDCVAAALRTAGVKSFLVEIGGELRGEGVKPDGLPWWVALEPPPRSASVSTMAEPEETIAALYGLSVATSGAYQRFFTADGRSYSHTIDPRTGYPVPPGLVSVTVIDSACMHADALATTLTVLGPDAGMALAVRENVAASFVMLEGERLHERVTPAFAAMLE